MIAKANDEQVEQEEYRKEASLNLVDNQQETKVVLIVTVHEQEMIVSIVKHAIGED